MKVPLKDYLQKIFDRNFENMVQKKIDDQCNEQKNKLYSRSNDIRAQKKLFLDNFSTEQIQILTYSQA